MREEDRLRLLKMGVAGHDNIEVALGSPRQLPPQPLQGRQNPFKLLSEIKAHIQGNLIVAASGGMQLSAHGADLLGEPALDIHVDILIGRGKRKFSPLDLSLNRPETSNDFLRLPR